MNFQASAMSSLRRLQFKDSPSSIPPLQLGHALSLLHDVTPSESEEAGELEKKMQALGISVSDDEWEDEDEE